MATKQNKSPAFQFYPQDYISSARVAEMTLEEEGVYIRLLCYCWSTGSIPADPERCAKLAGKGCSIKTATNVQQAFNKCSTDDQRLVHDRLEHEREQQQIRRNLRSFAGKQSAAKRALSTSGKTTKNKCSTSVQQKVNSSSSSSDEDDSDFDAEDDVPTFQDFWNMYPRRKGKQAAAKSWTACVKKTDPQLIIDGLKKFVESSKDQDIKFIPHPATWLNQGRWEDEIEPPVKSKQELQYWNRHDSSTAEGRAAIEREFLENLHT